MAVEAVLLDIEGTTTPIAFVHETLFGYARARLREFLNEHHSRPDVAAAIARLCEEWIHDEDARSLDARSRDLACQYDEDLTYDYVLWLMDRDRKSPGLKALQGFIWEEGYRAGTLVSEIFPDVAPAIRAWRASGLKVAIYSSGSVLAQQLLFAHTTEGDLTSLFDAFFDTGVGAKTSPQSYRAIAGRLGTITTRVLFVSDTPKELEAATEAGCLVELCVRPGSRFDAIVIR